MALDLRPLTLGELLDRAFSLYRGNFRTFVAIMAPPAACAAGLGLVGELLPAVGRTLSAAGEDPGIGLALAFVGATLLFGILYSVTYVAAFGATTSAVSEAYLGRPTSAAAAYQRVRDRLGRLMLLMLLIALRVGGLVFVGSIAAGVAVPLLALSAQVLAAILAVVVILGVLLLAGFLALRYALSFAVLVLEPVTASEALRRSVELTRGNLLKTFALGLFATIIAYITLLVFQGPFMTAAVLVGPDTTFSLALSLIGAFTGAVAGAISGPIMIVALALLYYDARIRQEGLDLQIMMQTLDGSAEAVMAPQPSTVIPG